MTIESNDDVTKKDLEEILFYKRLGFPFFDHGNGSKGVQKLLAEMKDEPFDDSDSGYWAITLPMSIPSPTSEGTVSTITLHAYTLDKLYAKAKAHMASLEGVVAPKEYSKLLDDPNRVAPPVTGLPYGIIDPDYARIFTQSRIVAWQYGYACMAHGSFTRDLDLLMVPWEKTARGNHEQILKLIAMACDLRFRDWCEDILKSKADFTEKPHGRETCTLYFPAQSDRRWVDISFMPIAPAIKGAHRLQQTR